MLVATYNIQWGKGRDGQVDLARIARTIGAADLIGLQEVERNWRQMEHADQVHVCRNSCLTVRVFRSSVDVDDSRRERRALYESPP